MDIKTIHEGLVEIKTPEFHKISSKAPVFYNPAMELNRDLSILAIKTFEQELEQEISICDAFGGSGIRGVRYAREIDNVSNVVISDINPLAIQCAKENIEINNLDNVKVYREDANILLRKCRGKFDVVDIDPFGTPSPFIESAGISLKAGGMICATATDTSALCGTYKEPCIRKYSAKPLKTEYCHEIGIRILAGFIARTLSKYKKCIEMKFAHSSEHYMRIYATISKGAKITDESLKNIGYILHCDNCLNRAVVKGFAPLTPAKCPVCSKNFKIAGPLWCGNILDSTFIDGMIKNMETTKINQEKKACKLLKMTQIESKAPPTHYDLHEASKNLKISAPRLDDVLDSLEERGFFASRTHFKPTGIKTDAPVTVLKEIITALHIKD
ncbi:MAG: tRNA (guanine(26)-N(2))-dimethyltransferase [Methanobacterium sp.]|uniref:tRNA (guanine(10)-N(2))-dimethyltransferase n=1 Tax=Methanobacterium sp. TaxID=2164 RepID=UPI003D6487E3|nr:tRNA (guanine(26)-N(2))-dimethyltransferase [Methanobacterium sp.]